MSAHRFCPQLFAVAIIKFGRSIMDQPQAIQLAAVAMAPSAGEARRGKAVELRDLGRKACLALESLPPTISPWGWSRSNFVLCRVSALAGLSGGMRFKTSLWKVPSLSRNSTHCWGRGQSGLGLFPYIPIVRALRSELWELSTTLAPDERQRLRMVVAMVHDEVMPLGNALNWAALRCLGLELNELAPQRE